SRWVNGAYGAHTCTAGYVWREAFWGDDVCVTTARRDQAKADNAAAISRRVPRDFAVQGPNRCKSGYSWRQADARDYVCVGSSSLSARASDNAAAASRWAASSPVGARPCKSGYVWREAFPGDDV